MSSGPFAEIKRRQAAIWGLGPLERVSDTMADIHDRLVARLGPRPGERWLDLATGTGPVARRAARAGADVTGLDLAPALVDTARRLGAGEGASLRFEVGDCEALPYPDGSFDVVASALGVIFAPDHAAVAGGGAGGGRAGGRRGLVAWEPDGGAARMTRLTASFAPGSPPPGAGNPLDWGRAPYVTERLGDAFELDFERGVSIHVEPSGEAMWRLFVESVGPVRAIHGSLEPERREALHRAFVALVEAHREGDAVRFPREYLLVVGRRRGPASDEGNRGRSAPARRPG
jgi:SAM-dependent methyltransferase